MVKKQSLIGNNNRWIISFGTDGFSFRQAYLNEFLLTAGSQI
jgi:hypothetical protein